MDILHEDIFDVARPVFRKIFQGWLISYVARRGLLFSCWGPLRNLTHLEGIPRLSEGGTENVQSGNLTKETSPSGASGFVRGSASQSSSRTRCPACCGSAMPGACRPSPMPHWTFANIGAPWQNSMRLWA